MPEPSAPHRQRVTQCWHEYGQKPGWYARLACGCIQQLQYGFWLSAPTYLPCAHHPHDLGERSCPLQLSAPGAGGRTTPSSDNASSNNKEKP